MIQRIQTLYLLGIVVLNGVLLLAKDWFIGGWSISVESIAAFLIGLQPILLCLSTLLAGITIFLFKRRRLQIRLNYLNLVVLLCFFGIVVYDQFSTLFHFPKATLFPAIVLLNLVLLHFAQKGVKRDEALIKSADRLR